MASFTVNVSSGAAAIIQAAAAYYGYATPAEWIKAWLRSSCIGYQGQLNEASLPDPSSTIGSLFP